MSLRQKAVVLVGKNARMREAIRGHLENNPALEKLLPHIGEPWNTGLGPEKTSFQAFGSTTTISRGTTEILGDVQLIETGDKVGASAATLPNLLSISPFSCGLVILQVLDKGSIYNPEVLDITEEALHSRFLEGVCDVASVCLQIGYPAVASVPHCIIKGKIGFERILRTFPTDSDSPPRCEKGFCKKNTCGFCRLTWLTIGPQHWTSTALYRDGQGGCCVELLSGDVVQN
ncbi:hypothetical protein QTO34_015074 [Cnephaeus nilssonii]|uniref:Large ribosomal subunit protein uL10 n=1 Tax=Cnephaeus nilssonii TaxID=3371016 RepID=A0AA40I4B5_CNENI|nr:hypothetical protein QTO34_015074 [Eptesicus nilssonii]